jgi:hypothetical protein
VVPGDKATDQENNPYIFDLSMFIELLLPPIRKSVRTAILQNNP